jgi:hypothetical protein
MLAVTSQVPRAAGRGCRARTVPTQSQIQGGGLLVPQPNVLIHWGSNFGPATLNGEWWRLFTSMFLHFGLVHLALNLNEPETSLHPDLLPALARLISQTAKQTQIWVVSHASRLIAALKEAPHC